MNGQNFPLVLTGRVHELTTSSERSISSAMQTQVLEFEYILSTCL